MPITKSDTMTLVFSVCDGELWVLKVYFDQNNGDPENQLEEFRIKW